MEESTLIVSNSTEEAIHYHDDQPMVKHLHDESVVSDSETSEVLNIPPEVSYQKPHKSKDDILKRKSQSEYPINSDSSAFINGNRSANPPKHIYAVDTSDIEKTPEPIKSTSYHRHRRSNSLNEALNLNRSKDAEKIIGGAISGGEISSVAARINTFRKIEAGSPNRDNTTRKITVGTLSFKNNALTPGKENNVRSVPFSSPTNDSIDQGLVNNKKLQLDEARKLQNLRPQKKEVSVKKIGDWRQRSQVLDTYTLTSQADGARVRTNSDGSNILETSSKAESVKSGVKSVPDNHSIRSKGLEKHCEEHSETKHDDIAYSETSANSPFHEKEKILMNDEMSAITESSMKYEASSPIREIEKHEIELHDTPTIAEEKPDEIDKQSVRETETTAEVEKTYSEVKPQPSVSSVEEKSVSIKSVEEKTIATKTELMKEEEVKVAEREIQEPARPVTKKEENVVKDATPVSVPSEGGCCIIS